MNDYATREDGMTLLEARINVGRRVIYQPEGGPREEGTITRVGTRFVFVRYRPYGTPTATDPEDLTLAYGA